MNGMSSELGVLLLNSVPSMAILDDRLVSESTRGYNEESYHWRKKEETQANYGLECL